MVCRTNRATSALISMLRAEYGFEDPQAISIYHSARAHGMRMAGNRPAAQPLRDETLMTLRRRARVLRHRGRLDPDAYLALVNRVDETGEIEASAVHAIRAIDARASAAAQALATQFDLIARDHGCTAEEARAAFSTNYRRYADHRRADAPTVSAGPPDAIAAPDDRGTAYVLTMMRANGPDYRTLDAAEAHARAEAWLANPYGNGPTTTADQCTFCGQFLPYAGVHSCPPPTTTPAPTPPPPAARLYGHAEAAPAPRTGVDAADPASDGRHDQDPDLADDPASAHLAHVPDVAAPAASTPQTAGERGGVATRRRTPMRAYGGGLGRPLRMMNRSAVVATLRREAPGATVEVPIEPYTYPAAADSLSQEQPVVTGAAAVRRSTQRRSAANPHPYGVRQGTLRCTCPQYAEYYTCPHVDGIIDRVHAVMNGDEAATAPTGPAAAVAAEVQADSIDAVSAGVLNRALFATAQGAPAAVSYTEDMAAFQSAWDEATGRISSGAPIPYQTEGVFAGIPDVTGDRTVGLEIEIDFPDSVDYRDKHRLAQAIYAAGLARDGEVKSWHYADRGGGGYSRDRNSWTVEFDRSMDGLNGQRGCEIVSPILSDTPQTWEDLATIMRLVQEHGGQCTPRTGLHVNVGAGDMDHDIANYNRVIAFGNAYEDVIVRTATNPVTGINHRGREYCRPMTVPAEGYTSISSMQMNLDPRGEPAARDARRRSHRAMINMDHVPSEGERVRNSTRIEMRIFDGSTDAGRVQASVKVAVGLVAAAARGDDPAIEPERAGTHRAAQGARRRRLTGEAWEADTRSVRAFVDQLFTRDEDKRQIVHAFAESRWQAR